MLHQEKSQKCYLDLGINLEWPNYYRRFPHSLVKGIFRKITFRNCDVINIYTPIQLQLQLKP